MELTGIRIVEYKDKAAEFSIYDVADIHWGNRGCSKEHLHRDIERIKHNPYALYAVGGDYVDFVLPGDRRFDPESIDTDIRVNDLASIASSLVTTLYRQFIPIAPKCIGWLYGNHDWQYLNRTGQMFLHDELCSDLDIPNMRYSGWADLYFVNNPQMKKAARMRMGDEPPKKYNAKLRIYIHHGAGAANTAGGKINALKRVVDNTYDADLVMMGHVHEQFAKSFTRLQPNENCTEIKQRTTMGLITGSYLKTYDKGFTGYGEQRAYSPTTMGATRARYSPSEHWLIVENKADGVGRP
jgi:predicted phosphodiesterase